MAKHPLELSNEEFKELENEELIALLINELTGNGLVPNIGEQILSEYIQGSALITLNKITESYLKGDTAMPEFLNEEIRAYLYFTNRLMRDLGVIKVV